VPARQVFDAGRHLRARASVDDRERTRKNEWCGVTRHTGESDGAVSWSEGLVFKMRHAIGHAGHQREREGLRSVGGASRRGRDAGWV
jgi:hypothetical protein